MVEENRPPEEGLAETLHDAWKAAIVIVDPSAHPDGQKVAVEDDVQVGNPARLIDSLMKAINASSDLAQWDIEVEPLFNAKSFWDFAVQNKGEITSIVFEFVTPNMFGGSDDLSQELREFREKEKAQTVKIALSSKNGLETDTSRTTEAVNYAEKGAGKIRARTKSGKTFNSERVVIGTEIESVPNTESKLSWVARLAGVVLGRD